MRAAHKFITSLAALVAITPGAAAAAVVGYLYINGVWGSATQAQHKDWIEVDSLQFGHAGTGCNTPPKTSGPNCENTAIITKPADAASKTLAQIATSGQTLPTVEIDLVGPGGQTIAIYHLTQVRILADTAAAGGGSETLTLLYKTQEVAYPNAPTNSTGWGAPVSNTTMPWAP